MKFVIKYSSVINVPVYFVFYVFPFISIIGQLFLGTRINYESFWMLLLFCFPYVSVKKSIKKVYFVSLAVLFFLLTLKYWTPLLFISIEISIRPFLIEMKWILYLSLALLWTNFVGIPDKQLLFKAGKFFCCIYIIYSLIIYELHGGIERVGIIDEANYDGFLMLIPFCFVFEGGYKKRDILLFVIATIMTGSRTGCMAMFVASIYYLFRKHIVLLMFSVPVLLGLFALLLMLRGETDIESVDRYIFFYQAYEYFNTTGLCSILIGTLPGMPLKMPVIPEFIWYIDNFNAINDTTGIYPFYFHSAYIRLAMILGIPLIVFCVWWLLYKFVKSYYYPQKIFIIIILLQSVSLATHSLTNVSPILFFAWIIMEQYSKKQYPIK